MNSKTLENDIQLVCDLANSKRVAGKRTIIGIAGPPASGKSILAEAVVHCLNQEETETPAAALLPMDGYHLDNHDWRMGMDGHRICNRQVHLPVKLWVE